MSMLLNTVHNHHLAERVGAALVCLGIVTTVHSRHVNCLRGVAASLVSGPSGARR